MKLDDKALMAGDANTMRIMRCTITRQSGVLVSCDYDTYAVIGERLVGVRSAILEFLWHVEQSGRLADLEYIVLTDQLAIRAFGVGVITVADLNRATEIDNDEEQLIVINPKRFAHYGTFPIKIMTSNGFNPIGLSKSGEWIYFDHEV